MDAQARLLSFFGTTLLYPITLTFVDGVLLGHWKFLHFHGQKTVRHDRFGSIHDSDRDKRTIFMRLVSPILFFAPDVHFRDLNELWTDGIIVEVVWKQFMQKLVSEWVEFVLYSTVLLAGNVAFLAIPGVINLPPPDQKGVKIIAAPAQIASTISLTFSVGSIVLGLLLVRRNRTMMDKEPTIVCEYLEKREYRWLGLEPLSVIFSLPYAFLMWSIWIFFVAVLLFSFDNMTTAIRAGVGAVASIVTAFILWGILNSWDSGKKGETEESLVTPSQYEVRIVDLPW
ncbi:hypothetical protein BC834DRAFT_966475 [Gloeopeniophorella convolvens]|nr:hypothetical protein BC834DRAFT_966475 [Gloeopeniophorella convolvens]